METDALPAAGPSTFRPTPALGVTYVLDTEEEEIKPIIPPPPGVDDINDKDYDPLEDQDIDEDDPEERFPYPTPSSVVHGKRKATEICDVDEEEPYQLRGKKTRLESTRKELECIYISSDSEDDVVQIPPKARVEKKRKRRGRPPKQVVAPSRPKSEQGSAEARDGKSASPDPEAEMGSVERVRPEAPNWLEMHLAKLRKEHPSAKLEICYHYSIEGDVWRVKCKACPRTCSVGPGQTLGYLTKHVKGTQHQAAVGNLRSAGPSLNDARKAKAAPRRDPSPPPAPAPAHRHDDVDVAPGPAASNLGREKAAAAAAEQDSGGDVERFLDQIRLPASLAPKLRAFGFESDERMSQIGGLSDESLGVLLDRLTERARVDMATAIIIREGLKRRAGTL